MTKKYADAQSYEAKLDKVMQRFGVDKYDYDWSRRACWVEFWYHGQYYRFDHSVENAKAHGQNIQHGSDIFAQVVLTLEDIARMTERGIYELQTWISGLKSLPPSKPLAAPFLVLQFDTMPETVGEINERYHTLVKTCHPDTGGSEEVFRRLTNARDEAIALLEEEVLRDAM